MRHADPQIDRWEVDVLVDERLIGSWFWQRGMTYWAADANLTNSLGINCGYRLLIDSQKDARNRFKGIKSFAIVADPALKVIDGFTAFGYRYDAESDEWHKVA